jgi:S1-C subfamily serine protease
MNAAHSVLAILWLHSSGRSPESYIGLHASLPAFAEEEDLAADPDLAPGLQVVRVVENSPAAQAGVQVGDAILRANGQVPRTPEHLDATVAALPPGAEVRMTARRGGQVHELVLVTVPRLVPREAPPPRRFVEGRRFGLALESLSTEAARHAGLPPGEGVRIQRLLEHGSAAGADLQPGDMIVAVNGVTVHGGDDFLAVVRDLEPGSQASFLVLKSKEWHSVQVPVREPSRHLEEIFLPPLFTYERDLRKDETAWGILLGLFKYSRKEARRTYRFFWLFRIATGSNEELEEVEG